jgi:hypothetical protein
MERKPKLRIRTFNNLITDLIPRDISPDAPQNTMPTITFRGGDGVEFDEVLISFNCDYTDPVHPYYSEPITSDRNSFGGSFEAIVFRTHTDIHFKYSIIIGGHYIARVNNNTLPQAIKDAIKHCPTWKEEQEAEEEVCS